MEENELFEMLDVIYGLKKGGKMAKKLTDAAKVIDVKHRVDKLLTNYKEHYSRSELIGRSIDALTDMYAILDAETDDKISMAVVKAELLRDVVKARGGK